MTAQEAAVIHYRNSERALRTYARWALQTGDEDGAREYLRLAHMVGVAMVREARNPVPRPDEWERNYPLDAYGMVQRLRRQMGHQ